MNSLPLGARDIAGILHPYTNAVRHEQDGPLVITSGSGIRVTDDQGREYIDSMAGLWCASLGFSQPRLAAAAARQMEQLGFYHLFSHKSHEPAIKLAERLIDIAPFPAGKVFFCNSGSEANDTAVKLIRFLNNARGRPGKKKIIARTKGYHGVTMMSASLTGLPLNHASFDLPLPGVLHVSCPHYYRFGQEGESEEAFSARMAQELEDLILREGPETVAAFFAEPVMGAGGVITPPKGYFQAIQEVLKRYDVLFVADEVICGFGRTGSMWGCQTYNLQPDILSCAKALTGGFIPLSALLVSDELYQDVKTETGRLGSFGHGYTYSGHPVAATIALETLDIYQELDIVGHVGEIAPVLQQGLAALKDHPLVGEIRGVGLIAAVELVQDRTTKAPFDPVGRIGGKLTALAQQEGLILRNLGDSIAFSPSLILTQQDAEEIVARFTRALNNLGEDKEFLAA
ncbi:MAG: aspartate aminotransferase family protein [Rhodospirillaceae bacterium]